MCNMSARSSDMEAMYLLKRSRSVISLFLVRDGGRPFSRGDRM
jgi:hypothetical protein